MGIQRLLVVALTLSLSGNVALFCWGRDRREPDSPAAPPPVSITSAPPSMREPTSPPDSASGPATPLPPQPAAADGGGDVRLTRREWEVPMSAPMPRGLDWCGTGRDEGSPPLAPIARVEEFHDGATRARMANDEGWNALLARLKTTDVAQERLALARAFLVSRARRTPRAELAELAHCVGTLELSAKAPAVWVVGRLYFAASSLRRSVDESWLRDLDPPPPPPTSAPLSGR